MSVTAVPIRPIAKGSITKLWIGVGALALIAGAVAWAGTSQQVAMGSPESFLTSNGARDGVTTTASGLQVQTLAPGQGRQIAANDGVILAYKGRLLDGTVFDESEAAPMLVGQVVPGFSEALQLMQPGGSYRIWLPPALAYGDMPPPGAPIPPNAVLDFDVSILQVVPDAALQAPPPGTLPPGL